MALTAPEAKILDILTQLDVTRAVTVRQLSTSTGLSVGWTRELLRGLAVRGLAFASVHSPPTWRATSRGRKEIRRCGYHDPAGADR